jgi:hypothetical protein
LSQVLSRQAAVSAFGLLGLLAGAPAVAQGLELTGVYGNDTGCAVNRGETVTSDDELLLKPDGFSSYATACEFVQMVSAKDGTKVVTGLCDHEGELGRTVQMLSISKSNQDPAALFIHDAEGEFRGEVRKCP